MMDAALARAFEATWPAAEYREAGGFRIARGMGGGGRLGAAVPLHDWQPDGIMQAIAAHRDWGQAALFCVPQGMTDLAQALQAQGFRPHKPTAVLHIPTPFLTDQPLPQVTALSAWPPLAIQREIWQQGGIDTPRQQAMDRAGLPKRALLGRLKDRAAGVAFLGISDRVAMIHAIHVTPAARRQRLAEWLMRGAGFIAAEHGATRLALAVAQENLPAMALCRKLGFAQIDAYDHWSHPGDMPATGVSLPRG